LGKAGENHNGKGQAVNSSAADEISKSAEQNLAE
jgi:hypothetical protein